MHNFSIKIKKESQSQKLIDVLGTDSVPIDPPIPVNSPEGHSAFLADLKMLTYEQRSRLINFLASEQKLQIKEIEELLPQYGFGISTKDCIMQHVYQQQIDLLRESFKQSTSKASGGNIKNDTVTEVFWLSVMIITFFLGDEWRIKNIVDNFVIGNKGMEYLRLGCENEEARYEHQFRLTLLADSLFLLQNCEGFDLEIEKLQKVSPANPEIKLEDIAIELQLASMLVKSGHEVKFRRRSGIKRQDFDIEIKFKKITTILGEIKCKRDETVVDVNNLRRTLYDAEKQLPTDNPSIVFVRIPEVWLKYGNLAPEVGRVIQNFFQKIFHINAVVFIWEDCITLPGNRKASRIKFRIESHPSPKNTLDNLNDLLLPIQILPSVTGSFLELSFGKFSD